MSSGKKILSFCPREYVGVSRVFRECEKIGVSKHLDPVPFDPYFDTLFLGGWVPRVYDHIVETYGRSRRVGVLWTSPLAQVEYVPMEMEFLRAIKFYLDAGFLSYLWVGSPDMLDVFPGNEKVFYAPYPLSLRSRDTTIKPERGTASLFGPLHPRKNVIQQMLAAKKADLAVYTTDNSKLYQPFTETIGLDLHWLGWLPEDRYYEEIQKKQIGLQVSHHGAESFSYTTWDHIQLGCPCLSTVPWLPPSLRCGEDWQDILLKIQLWSEGGGNPEYILEQAKVIAEQRNRLFLETFRAMVDRA